MFHFSDLLLILSSFLAGALNSIAGGGSFLTFPTLLFYGIPPIIANASSTLALFPGSLAASWAYRQKFSLVKEVSLLPSLGVCLGGGILGAELLLKTPESGFITLIPYLLLFSTLLFTFGGNATLLLKDRFKLSKGLLLGALFTVAVYGGYFGGGIGILILALLTLAGLTDIHSMNALKTLLGGCLNGIAVVLFVAAHAVNWRVSFIMMGGAIAGGVAGASYAKSVNPVVLRRFISTIGMGLTLYFFINR